MGTKVPVLAPIPAYLYITMRYFTLSIVCNFHRYLLGMSQIPSLVLKIKRVVDANSLL